MFRQLHMQQNVGGFGPDAFGCRLSLRKKIKEIKLIAEKCVWGGENMSPPEMTFYDPMLGIQTLSKGNPALVPGTVGRLRLLNYLIFLFDISGSRN